MRKYIHKHLDEKYEVSTSKVGNKGIYLIETRYDEFRYPIYCQFLLEEIVTIFSIEIEKAKIEINLWANKNTYNNLDFYWNTSPPFFLPSVTNFVASTISQDLVSVQSMTQPNAKLFYLDYVYEEKRLYKIVLDKVNKVLNYIKDKWFRYLFIKTYEI